MDDIKEVFGRINQAMIIFSSNLESKLKTLLHQLNEGLKKLKLNKEDEQKQMYQDKLLLLFRKSLSNLMKNWSKQESEETSTSIKELVKLIFWCAKKEIVLVKDALSFSEDFCDMLSVNDLREFIDTFESSIHTINYLSEQDSNYPLKICNVIFKKLTRTYDTRLRGELHIFLSKILPICHASGLKSKICTEITAQLENENESSQIQSVQNNSIEIEEEKAQPENITYSNKDFYKKFWTLQKYFQNPFCLSTNEDLLEYEKSSTSSQSTSMEEEEVEEGEEKIIESKKIKAVCSAIQLVLDRFNQNPVFEKREANIKPYIKYLTTYSLLEKQLSDPFFRKIWLLQALLFFSAIQNKTKDLEIKNIESELALIKSTEEKVKKTFIQIHENLKEEINFEKLELFFIDEKIWVERKDILPRQNKDEKYNFKNPCEKTREMIDYYQKSVLLDKKDNQQKSEFSFDSHKMLQQKQFAEMEAFKKKVIQDCCKSGGNSITEESNLKQILTKELAFPIKTNPIQKSIGYYINQVIDQLKDTTSEQLVDDPIFVTKAMRASFRYNLNWVEKDKETLKDLENFAKEFEEKDTDKTSKQEKEKERDKSSFKEPQIQSEQVQPEEQKKSKVDKNEKSSRPQNEDDSAQLDQTKNNNANGTKFSSSSSSSRQEDKSKPIKINQGDTKQAFESQKNANTSTSQSLPNPERVSQSTNPNIGNSGNKSSQDSDQKSKINEDRNKKEERSDRQSNNESTKSESKIEEPKSSRSDIEKEKTQYSENSKSQVDDRSFSKASDEQSQVNNDRIRPNRQENNFSDSKNDEIKSSREERSMNNDRNERGSQSQSQKQVSDDKYKNKNDSKPQNDERKPSKDEGKRFSQQEDSRKNNDEIRKNNDDSYSGFDKNDNQKQYSNNSSQNQNSSSSSKNYNQEKVNTSSASSSKNIEIQKNENKQGDESSKSQNQGSSNNQNSGNFSSSNNNSISYNIKPSLNLKKNEQASSSQQNSNSSTGGRSQNKSRSKEKQTYSSNSGSSRSNNNGSNNYNNQGNNNSNGNNGNYNNYNSGNNQQQGNYSSNNSYQSKYSQHNDSKQNSGYNQQNNNYNQPNYNMGNNNNSNNYPNKRDQYNSYDSNNGKRDNYDRQKFQNSNFSSNKGNDYYEPGPNKRQKK